VAASTAAEAEAQPAQRTARLVYDRGAGAEPCPDAARIEEAVAARLGYNPFVDQSELLLRISVSATGERLSARIEVRRGESGVGERVLDGPADDCRELAESVVLATSIAIDPTALSRAPATDPESPPPIVAVPPQPQRPPEAAPAASRLEEAPSELSYGGRFGISGTLGTAPGPSFGMRLEIDLRWTHASIGVAGRVDFPASERAGGGTVEGSVLLGEVSACGWMEPVFACGVAAVGAFRGVGRDLVDSRDVTKPHVGLGGRVGVEIPIYGAVSVRLQLDVLAAITQTTLLVGDERVWTMAPVSGTFSALLGLRFS
jgi:hypothetical protein